MSGDQLVTKLSSRSVADTVSRLSEVLAEKGVKLFAVIDHSGEAHGAGLELRDTKVVIFGAPKAGTPVMQAVPVAALDLPLKVLVWADATRPSSRTRRRRLSRRATASATIWRHGSERSTR